jgi:hypothetical protein
VLRGSPPRRGPPLGPHALAQSHLAQSHLAQSHLAQSHLAQFHLAQSHLAQSHLPQSRSALRAARQSSKARSAAWPTRFPSSTEGSRSSRTRLGEYSRVLTVPIVPDTAPASAAQPALRSTVGYRYCAAREACTVGGNEVATRAGATWQARTRYAVASRELQRDALQRVPPRVQPRGTPARGGK